VPTRAKFGPLQANLTKLAMEMYIASMCVALPVTLFPLWLLRKGRLVSKTKSEHISLETAELCAQWLLWFFPFVRLTLTPYHDPSPEPSVWVANHVSQIDTFLLLAADRRLRGPHKRPIKVVYWQGLDENPIIRLFFHMAGFIPVQMANNGNGNPNDYDTRSFKKCLRAIKQAFHDGFDILLLPEGQLNPTPRKGLLPVFSGAYHVAKMSHRPIRFLGIHGSHELWHADTNIGMQVTARDVSMKIYPPGRYFDSGEDFVQTFEAVIGHYGTFGTDLPDEELQRCLFGTKR